MSNKHSKYLKNNKKSKRCSYKPKTNLFSLYKTNKDTKERDYVSKREKGHITFLALDTNVLIDMAQTLSYKYVPQKDKEYFDYLKYIMQQNVLTPFNERKRNGKYVFCITPAVQEEIVDNTTGKVYPNLIDLFSTQGFVFFEPDNSKSKQYKQFKKTLTKLYKEQSLYIKVDRTLANKSQKTYYDADGFEIIDSNKYCNKVTSSQDSPIVFDASYFNLTLLSRDKHIVSPLVIDADKKLKSLNAKVMGNFRGEQAVPMRVEKFLYLDSKGFDFPKPRNLDILKQHNQKLFSEVLKYNEHAVLDREKV